MPRTKMIYPNTELKIKNGPPEFAIFYKGDRSDGKAVYLIKQKGSKVKKQVLSGLGSMQIYENVRYPVKILNEGYHSIMTSAAD